MTQIVVPIYRAHVDVLTTRREAETYAGANGLGLDRLTQSRAMYNAWRAQNGGLVHVLYVEPREPVWVMVHECAHLAAAILHNAGVGYDAENDEAFAYLLGYLVEQITPIARPRLR